MANPVIRTRMIELLTGGDFTVTALADRLAVPYNSAAKAIVRAREEGEVHVCGYAARTAAIYRLGAGVDAARPALDPVVPAPSCRDDLSLIRERAVSESVLEYFELDVLPGVKHFTCDRYKATLSVQSCAERWALANEGASDERQSDRMRSCLKCHTGALHAGKSDMNMSPWKGSMMCARCGEGASRLVGRHLCLSHYNRQRERLLMKNAKGTAPKMHPPLHRRSVSFLTDGAVKTKTIEYTIGLEEVMFSVLRDEVKTVKFGAINVHPALAALRANPDLDFEIRDDVEAEPVASVANVADVVQDLLEHAVVPIPLADVNVPVPSELDVVQADPAADVEADSYGALRDAVEQLEQRAHDAPVCATSRRAAKRQRQQQRRQLRVSSVTANLLISIGALQLPAPLVVAPVPAAPSYSPMLMSGGSAFG
ncbi:hypothetical protein [Paraburkholderia dipogonis]|uniref:hypothetical protein n=1 Tax=Paraburkholderia dipogonis TaxID=1211383 RepID=UPI0038B7F1FB